MQDFNWKNALKKIMFSLIIPVGIFLIFAVLTNGRTASIRVITTTFRQAIVPILICYGLMINMTTGMVNFSAGAMMLCAGIIGGNIARATGTGVMGLILVCMSITVVLGLTTGLLYNLIRVPAMVLTIGLLMVFETIPRLLYPNGIVITGAMTMLSREPYNYYIFLAMGIFFYLLMHKTAFGHNLSAVGNNQAIAISAGLDIDKIKLLSFIFGSVFLGVASVLHVSESGELRNVSSLGSMAIMMDGFMGVFMSIFLSRYCNITIAVVIGTYSMRFLSNGFVAMGFSSTARDIVQGLFLLVLLTISANAGFFEKRGADKTYAAAANQEALSIKK